VAVDKYVRYTHRAVYLLGRTLGTLTLGPDLQKGDQSSRAVVRKLCHPESYLIILELPRTVLLRS